MYQDVIVAYRNNFCCCSDIYVDNHVILTKYNSQFNMFKVHHLANFFVAKNISMRFVKTCNPKIRFPVNFLEELKEETIKYQYNILWNEFNLEHYL